MSFLEDFKKLDTTTLFQPTDHMELLPSQSGTHFLVAPGLNSYGVRLPPPTQKGMKFMFTKIDASEAFSLEFNSYNYLFTGTIIRSMNNPITGSTITSADDRNWIHITDDAVVGDFIQMVADGTSWIITACSNATVGDGIVPATV